MFNNINTRSITFNLIVINVIVFIATSIFPQLGEVLSMHYIFNTHGYVPESYGFSPFQIVTSSFMHFGILHILLNMYFLFMFGQQLETALGAKRFLTLYIVTMLGAVFLSTTLNMVVVHNFTGSVNPTIEMLNNNPGAYPVYLTREGGASGAIFGVLVGFAMLFPNLEIIMLLFPIPIKVKYWVLLYILIEIYESFTEFGIDNIGHFAHLGGALFAYLLISTWRYTDRRNY